MAIRNAILATTAAGVFLLISGSSALAQQQSTAQQKCLNLLNKDGTLVAKQRGKTNAGCLKDAGLGKLVGTAQACLTADPKGKVQKKQDKTTSDDIKSCGTAPSFGYTGPAPVNTAALQAELDLVADIFGTPLDTAVITCASSKDGCNCQKKVYGDALKLADTKLKEFVTCKKTALKGGASSAAALESCVSNAATPGSIAADTKGKIQKKIDTLNTGITKKCDEKGVTASAFPGDCTTLGGAALGTCVDVQVECRVCQAINEMDGLFVNCDLFDDGVANASCASGTGPTPTPSPSPTPSPTPSPGGVELQGALTATNGRFNYNLTVGVPGANAACNTNFPGTHACTVSELQAAAAAGDLDGLKDTANNTVTSFWAIDPTHANTVQCTVSVAWDYDTVHTGQVAEVMALNNAAGTLGPVSGGVCFNSSWVGCCL